SRVKIDSAAFRSATLVQDDWTSHLEDIGKKLFSSLMQGRLARAYRDAADAGSGKLRVRVCSDHPDVVSYPWELLCDPLSNNALARRSGFTLVRSGENIEMKPLPPVGKPLRVLVVAASPEGYTALDCKNEIRLIKECVHVVGECEVKTIEGPNTYKQL